MRYIPALDGLRGVAVVLVLLYHFPFVEGIAPLNWTLRLSKEADAGYIGVEIFFVLSGYLITRILLNDIREKNGRVFGRFYLKRVLRILPVFYLTIVICALLIPGYNYLYSSVYLANYYFSFDPDPHPLRHFWSLAVEEQFYLFWPLLLVFSARNSRRLKALFILVVGSSVLMILLRDVVFSSPLSRALIYRSLETRMLALGIGGLFACYGLPKLRTRTVLAALASVLLLISLVRGLYDPGGGFPVAAAKAFSYDATAALVFVLAANGGPLIGRLFSLPPLIHLGKISYGLYAYHLPIFFYFGVSHMQLDGQPTNAATAAIITLVTIAATMTSWHLLERPLLRLKKRLT